MRKMLTAMGTINDMNSSDDSESEDDEEDEGVDEGGDLPRQAPDPSADF
jgi:hypothetical protein